MAHWKVNLLGEFQLFAPNGERVILSGRKHRALIAYLLLSNNRLATRERLIELLWSTRSEQQARASLRGVLSEIRSALSVYQNPPVRADRTQVFITNELDVDVDTLNNVKHSTSIDELSNAVAIFNGELLESISLNEQIFEDWKLIEQQNIKSSYRNILLRYLQLLEQGRENEKIETIANRLLSLDEVDEDAHRTLIELYHHQGKASLALRQFELYRSRLKSQYDTDPPQEMMALNSTIKSNSMPLVKGVSDFSKKGILPLPSRPGSRVMPEVALAVLPFKVAESDLIGEEFGDLISEEIIGAAARFKWFRVVPRSESFKQTVITLGSSDLSGLTGAKYILYGKIRKNRDQHVLTIELVDGFNSRTCWSERFDISGEEFSYPDDIVAKVVGQLDVKIRASEISQAHNFNREELTAYQCSLLALSNIFDLSNESYRDSENLFARAIKLNPNDSWFYSIWALWKTFCVGQVWGGDVKSEFKKADELARQAIKRDPDDALSLIIRGHIESFLFNNLEQSKKLIDSSLKLNPYSSFAWMLSSATYSYSGMPLEALSRLEKSKALCPVEPHFEFLFDTANCVAHLFNHDPEQALPWGYKSIQENSGFSNGYKHLLVALGHMKHTEECKHYLNKLMDIEPTFQIESFLDGYPFALVSDKDFYRQGLLLALSASESQVVLIQ